MTQTVTTQPSPEHTQTRPHLVCPECRLPLGRRDPWFRTIDPHALRVCLLHPPTGQCSLCGVLVGPSYTETRLYPYPGDAYREEPADWGVCWTCVEVVVRVVGKPIRLTDGRDGIIAGMGYCRKRPGGIWGSGCKLPIYWVTVREKRTVRTVPVDIEMDDEGRYTPHLETCPVLHGRGAARPRGLRAAGSRGRARP
jgi:hypothetical protein